MLTGWLAKRIKRRTNSYYCKVLWIEPFGYPGRWVVDTRHADDRPDRRLSERPTLLGALFAAWREARHDHDPTSHQ